jgi:hypothetical protein
MLNGDVPLRPAKKRFKMELIAIADDDLVNFPGGNRATYGSWIDTK